MIDTEVALADFLPRLASSPWIAMDTEADSLHSYPEKLCLIQLSLPGEDVLIDPLAKLNLQPLFDLLARGEIIFHGADYDLRLLFSQRRFVPGAVFDTMVAARLLGLPEFGLNSLVRRFLNVELEKGPQKANWSRRPLTPRMVTYARNDSRYLKPLADAMRSRLEAAGRTAWHEQMCRQLIAEATASANGRDPDAWRIKAADLLGRRALAVLRELWYWREQEAIASNRPPFFVLSHDALFNVAVAAANGGAPHSALPPHLSPRRRASLLQAVEQALALPESRWPQPRRHRGHRLTPAQKRQLDALRHRRDRAAARLGIDPTLIASRATLAALASDWDRHSVELLPWQRELLTS